MNLYWLYDLSSLALCLLVVSCFVLPCLIGLFVSRRWVRRLHPAESTHNDIVGFYLAAITVFDAVTLGLVAVATWQTYTDAQLRVDQEASALGALYRDVSAYPEPFRTQLQNDLRLYYHELVDVGWPQQQHGIVPNMDSAVLDQFQAHFLRFEPATEQQKIIATQTYRTFDDLVQSRRTRINSITTELPSPIWVMIVMGAVLSVVATWFFHTERFSMHVWLSVVYSALIGLLIYLIVSLDNPYRGRISVGPEPLIRVYQQTMLPK